MAVEHPQGANPSRAEPTSSSPQSEVLGGGRRLVIGWVGLIYGIGAAVVLLVSFGWPPEAIAAGAPWTELGFRPVACVGCALCGLSRAFSLLSHGEVLVAMSLNPLVFFAWPLTWVVALGGPALFIQRNRRA